MLFVDSPLFKNLFFTSLQPNLGFIQKLHGSIFWIFDPLPIRNLCISEHIFFWDIFNHPSLQSGFWMSHRIIYYVLANPSHSPNSTPISFWHNQPIMELRYLHLLNAHWRGHPQTRKTTGEVKGVKKFPINHVHLYKTVYPGGRGCQKIPIWKPYCVWMTPDIIFFEMKQVKLHKRK